VSIATRSAIVIAVILLHGLAALMLNEGTPPAEEVGVEPAIEASLISVTHLPTRLPVLPAIATMGITDIDTLTLPISQVPVEGPSDVELPVDLPPGPNAALLERGAIRPHDSTGAEIPAALKCEHAREHTGALIAALSANIPCNTESTDQSHQSVQ
jgi:hypothetical protein